MSQPNPRAVTRFAALLLLLGAACSSAPEQPILNQFFSASRLRDNTSLQNFAMVTFDPRTEGTVSSFDITSVTPEQHKPLNLKALGKALDDIKAEDAAYTKRKETYYTANEEAIDKVLKAEGANTALKGKEAEVQAAWAKLREEGTQISKRIGEAKSKLAAESAIIELSVSDQRVPVDVKKYDGELVSKDITVQASVKAPGGQTAPRTIVVTMQRGSLKGDREITGRWVITSVK